MKNSFHQPLFRREILIIVLFGLLVSACQPLGLQVELVSASADLLKVSAPDCKYGGNLKEIEAVDPFTVKFVLCDPDPSFAAKVAFPVFAIQDSDFLAANNGDSRAMSIQPNSSGPYRLRQYVPGNSVVLEANPDYWGTPPNNETLVFRWGLSPVTRFAEIQFGNLEVIDRPEPNSYFSIRTDPSLRLEYRPSLNVSYLGMNNQLAPFQDERVRRAFGTLLDRQLLVNNQYPLGSEVAQQFIPPAMEIGYTPAYRWIDFNQKEGQDLLAEANYDFSQVITLAFSEQASDYLPRPEAIAQEVKSQLAQYGIQITLKRMPAADFETAVAQGKEALFISGWSADYPDAASFYATAFAKDSLAFGTPYSDINFMLTEAARSVDPKVRQSRYNRLNELINLHVPAIPLAHGKTALVFTTDVTGQQIGPLTENFEEMSTPENALTFMQTREPASLWPGDETDPDTLRITRLLYSTLVEYEFGGTLLQPGLAESWETNDALTEWTFHLRYGLKFSNGTDLTANDVVATFTALWDASSPLHTGRSGDFSYFKRFFGGFLNEAPDV